MTTQVKTEVQHKGEFIVSEGNNTISREVYILTSGQIVGDGRLMSIVGGKLVASTGHLNSGGTSDEVIAGFIHGAYNASSTGPRGAGDWPGVTVTARQAEVDAAKVTLHAVSGGGAAAATTAVKAALAAKFVFLR